MQTVGSRAQVWHGTAEKTSGGLKKKDLTMNKKGAIVSKKKQLLGKKLYSKKSINCAFKKQQKLMKSDPIGFRAGRVKKTAKAEGDKVYKKCMSKSKSKSKSKKKKTVGRKKKRCPPGSRRSKSGKRCIKY